MTEAKPKRRWFRFSLRGLLIVVTAICVLLGSAMFWYRSQEAEYNRQQEIAARISRHAYVTWESELPDWFSGVREWRISEAFKRAAFISNGRLNSFSDNLSVIALLPKLPNVRGISIHEGELTDQVLKWFVDSKSSATLYVRFGTQGQEPGQDQIENRLRIIRQKFPDIKMDYDDSFP